MRDVSFFVQKAELYGLLASTLHLRNHSQHESRTTGDGLAVALLVVEADVKIPPVLEQGDEVSHESAGAQLLR